MVCVMMWSQSVSAAGWRWKERGSKQRTKYSVLIAVFALRFAEMAGGLDIRDVSLGEALMSVSEGSWESCRDCNVRFDMLVSDNWEKSLEFAVAETI